MKIELRQVEYEEDLDDWLQQKAELLVEEDLEHDKKMIKEYAKQGSLQNFGHTVVMEEIDFELGHISNSMEDLGKLHDILRKSSNYKLDKSPTADTLLQTIINTIAFTLEIELNDAINKEIEKLPEKHKVIEQL